MNKTTMTTTAAPVDQTDAAALDAIETALLVGSLDAQQAVSGRFRRTSLRSAGRPPGASAICGGRSAGSTRRSSPSTSCVSRAPGLPRRSSQNSCRCHLPQTATARPGTGTPETKRARRPAHPRRRACPSVEDDTAAASRLPLSPGYLAVPTARNVSSRCCSGRNPRERASSTRSRCRITCCRISGASGSPG